MGANISFHENPFNNPPSVTNEYIRPHYNGHKYVNCRAL